MRDGEEGNQFLGQLINLALCSDWISQMCMLNVMFQTHGGTGTMVFRFVVQI